MRFWYFLLLHSQFLKWWIPILIVSVVGVAVGVVFLVVGCVFWACRCCGHCKWKSQQYSHDSVLCSCSLLLLLCTLGLLWVAVYNYVPFHFLVLVFSLRFFPQHCSVVHVHLCTQCVLYKYNIYVHVHVWLKTGKTPLVTILPKCKFKAQQNNIKLWQ